MTGSIYPHLLDLLADPSVARDLILAGGYGLQVKQKHLQDRGAHTLFPQPPPARATMDLDFILRMELFIRTEGAQAVRRRLDALGYKLLTPKLQFQKPLAPGAAETLKVDLLSRLPEGAESDKVNVKGLRVGIGAGSDLHGHQTPEAFAVEDSPDEIPLTGRCTDGSPFGGSVLVPNIYAWLNLKVAAAGDWLNEADPGHRGGAAKHVFDVLVLIAMLTEEEFTRCLPVRDRFRDHPRAEPPRLAARSLFGTSSSPGVIQIRRQHDDFDYATFWETMTELMGL